MNKKITIKKNNGQLAYCVLSSDESFDEQLEKVFDLRKGCGLSAVFNDNEIIIRDYFHGENRANIEIISIEDTNEKVSYDLK